jgi:hypothetical protein
MDATLFPAPHPSRFPVPRRPMISRFARIAAAAALLAAPVVLRAQEVPPAVRLTPGTRVRISTPASSVNGQTVANAEGWQAGTVLPADSGYVSLRLDRDGTEVTYPLSLVREIQVSRGTLAPGQEWQRDASRGALFGGSAGGVVMLISWIADKAGDASVNCKSNCPDDYTALDRGILRPTVAHVALWTAGGAAAGALIGTLFGHTRQREEWVPVRFGAARIEILPGGALLSLRL